MQVVGGQQHGTGRQRAVSRSTPAAASTAAAMPAFMSDEPLPVRRPSSHLGRHERQVDRVEVAVELKRAAGLAAAEADGDGRRRGWPPSGCSTLKPSARSSSASRSDTAPADPVGLGTSISLMAVSTRR